MYKGTPYVNKIVKKKQQDRVKFYHKNNLRNVRPITSGLDVLENAAIINNKKKQMLQEDRFTQIQRQNRMLLEKIQIIMSKKNPKQVSLQKARMNKSLNHGFRKKQLEGIQVQNAKLLKRLQQKKSSYQAQKLKDQWKKQKNIIKNLANYPFIIRDMPQKRKSITSQSLYKDLPSNNLQSNIQLMRIRQMDGQSFLVTVKLDQDKLHILADNKATKQIKIIEINREQAIQFIDFQCDNRIQKIYDRLRYDSKNGVLYLVGKNAKVQYQNPQQKMENIHQEAQHQIEDSIITQKNKQQNAELDQKNQLLKSQAQFKTLQVKNELDDNQFIQKNQEKLAQEVSLNQKNISQPQIDIQLGKNINVNQEKIQM